MSGNDDCAGRLRPGFPQPGAWFSMGTLDAGLVKEYKLHGKKNGVYLFVIEGEVEVANTVLSKRDGAGFWDTDSIAIEVLKHATVLLMEVPMV